MYNPKSLKSIWQPKLLEKNFRNKLFVSLVVLAIVLFSLARFLVYNEGRVGYDLTDPLLSLFKPMEVTWFTFLLIYVALVAALYTLSFFPEEFLIAIQSYSIVAFLRLTTIYLLPLNAPATIIPLDDPFIAFFGNGQTFLKDLFFSGHTATMFVFYLTAVNKNLRIIFLAATVVVAVCVLVQHVHYTIDVLVAPFMAYGSYRISLSLNSQKK